MNRHERNCHLTAEGLTDKVPYTTDSPIGPVVSSIALSNQRYIEEVLARLKNIAWWRNEDDNATWIEYVPGVSEEMDAIVKELQEYPSLSDQLRNDIMDELLERFFDDVWKPRIEEKLLALGSGALEFKLDDVIRLGPLRETLSAQFYLKGFDDVDIARALLYNARTG